MKYIIYILLLILLIYCIFNKKINNLNELFIDTNYKVRKGWCGSDKNIISSSNYPSCINECQSNTMCKAIRWINNSKECNLLTSCNKHNNDSRWSHIKDINKINTNTCPQKPIYLMADGGGNASQGPSYFWSPSYNMRLAVTGPAPGGFKSTNKNNVLQRFRFKKCKPGRNPLGGANNWYNTSASLNNRIIKHGDIVSVLNSQYGKVYDCAWNNGCSMQRFPPPAGHWGTPYRIYSLGSSHGKPIKITDTVYFDRMRNYKWDSNKSLYCNTAICKGGSTTMNQRTNFRFTPVYPNTKNQQWKPCKSSLYDMKDPFQYFQKNNYQDRLDPINYDSKLDNYGKFKIYRK